MSLIEKELILEGLNPEQKAVVEHKNGPILAVAVAGAGKTAALVRRIAYLVKVHGVDPSRILAVTFSKKAADEMNERLTIQLGGRTEARVGTFHSVALQILKEERPEYSEDWKIDDRNQYRLCLKHAVGYQHMNWREADVTLLENYIGLCKARMLRPGDEARDLAKTHFYDRNPGASTSPAQMVKAYTLAEDMRQDRQLITFDDMILEAAELLQDEREVLPRWDCRWDYVLQDEAQDQNLPQLIMGAQLAKRHRNYMLVGDPAQSIFAFRGAEPSKLLSFQQDWDSKVVQMGRNYRCGKTIISAANKVLGSMAEGTRLPFDMVAELGHDGEVSATGYDNADKQAEAIANNIQTQLADGHEPRDIFILYRVNAQSRGPEEALIKARIPYRIIGGTNFYERREVKDLLAYLRLGASKGDAEDVKRCINSPFRYLGKRFVDKLMEASYPAIREAEAGGYAVRWSDVARDVAQKARIQSRQADSANEWASIIDYVAQKVSEADQSEGVGDTSCRPAAILEHINMRTRYCEWLRKEEGEESPENSRASNVRELIRASERFNTVDDLLAYVDAQVKASKDERRSRNPNKVTLMTLHRSKGLEAPIVYIPGVAEGILPHGKSDDMEEERRLFYVGVTRAKKQLHISYPEVMSINGKVLPMVPSRFIEEAGLTVEHCEDLD